jgi:kynurenine formamidase
MCTEKCFTGSGLTGSGLTRRTALLGGAAVAASAVLGGTAHAGERAPGHFTVGGRLAPELQPSELIVPAVVIDIARRAARDPDTVVTVEDLRAFERKHGRIPRDAAVLMHSGWGARVTDADAYRGTDAAGTLHFPGFGADATEWLLRRRGIRSLGVDTLSIDPGNSSTFDTHLILTGADRYGLENLANLDRIPKRGATIVVGLIPYEEGSGGQARIFASW